MSFTIDKLPFNLRRLQKEVNILLISDLHYDIKKNASLKDEDPYKGETVNSNLVNSIKAQDPNWHPDIVIVAGDLVNFNGQDNYALFHDLVFKLTDEFSYLKYAFFTTPGNHDVTRDNFLTILPYLQQLCDCKKEDVFKSFTNNKWVDIFLTISKRKFKDMPGLDKALSRFEEKYFETYLFNRDEFEKKELYGRTRLALEPSKLEFTVDGFKTVYYKQLHGITLICHNSSFFCDLSQASNDRNHLFLIRELVEQTMKKVVELPNAGPVISFMHHPFYYLHETEHVAPIPQDVKEEDQFNNFNKIVRDSDLILSGHVHGELHDPAYLQNSAYLITNGTSYTSEKLYHEKSYPLTYALIKVNKQLGKFALKKFIYREDGKGGVNYEPRANADSKLKYYNFLERSRNKPSLVEVEKVKTLEYFSALKEYQKNQQETFFLAQLDLYIENIVAGEFEYGERTDHKISAKVFEFSEGLEYRVQIILIDGTDYLRDINTILSEQLEDFNHKGGVIYFSVNRESLKTDGILSAANIQTLHKAFRCLVQTAKIDYVSINLLYH